MNQIVMKMATELQYPERYYLMKQVNMQNVWTFEISAQEALTCLYGFL